MTAPIGPGDFVEHFRKGHRVGQFSGRAPQLQIGSIYRVERLWDGSLWRDGNGAASLVEIPGYYPDGDRFKYCLSGLRPIYRPSATLTQRLMEPVSDRIEPGVSRKSRQGNPATADQ